MWVSRGKRLTEILVPEAPSRLQHTPLREGDKIDLLVNEHETINGSCFGRLHIAPFRHLKKETKTAKQQKS